MSAGRNLMEWKTRRREVPKWLEPSLSDGASAEEEGLDHCNYTNQPNVCSDIIEDKSLMISFSSALILSRTFSIEQSSVKSPI